MKLVLAAAHSQMECQVCFGPAQQLSDISLLQYLLAPPAAKKALLMKHEQETVANSSADL